MAGTTDDLIEKTLDAMAVPFGLRARARDNLREKTEAEVKAILNNALIRKEKAKEWIKAH